MKAGTCIDIWDGEAIQTVVYLGDEKGKLRVLTAQGKEQRIPDSRVANVGSRTLEVSLPAAALGREAKAHDQALIAAAATVDLPALWEVLADEGGSYALDDLAELALGSREGDARSTVLRRLIADPLYFSRKKLEFAPRSREELDETRKRRSAEEERAHKRAEFVAQVRAFLAGGGQGPAPPWPRGSERFFETLRDFAVHGLESSRIREALALLEDLGVAGRGAPPLAAFEVLVRTGVFDRDENLLLHRYSIRREFPGAALEDAALRAAAPPGPGERRDLTGLDCFAIDDPETSEVDDALSIEPLAGGRLRLGVHIADPGALIPPGSPVDLAARDRATTYYLPDERILMLPPVLAEQAASLRAGEARAALSFLVELDARGEVLGCEMAPSTIRVRRRLSYEEADQAIASGGGAPGLNDPETLPAAGTPLPAPPAGLDAGSCERLALAARVARALTARRAEQGALLLKGPDASIRVREGRIEFRRIEPWTPSWVLVSESMILANRLAAERLRAAGVPAIYRRQAAAETRIELPPGYDPAAAAAARRAIKRTEIGLTPGPHAGLGLPAYVQVTSPIRRYQDLACQRQLVAVLRGETPPFTAETLWAVAAATDEAEKQAREVERDRREYWLLRHLETLPAGTALEATITRAEDRRTLVELTEFVHVTVLPPRPGHRPGLKLKLVVDAVNPRGGRLVLRETS